MSIHRHSGRNHSCRRPTTPRRRTTRLTGSLQPICWLSRPAMFPTARSRSTGTPNTSTGCVLSLSTWTAYTREAAPLRIAFAPRPKRQPSSIIPTSCRSTKSASTRDSNITRCSMSRGRRWRSTQINGGSTSWGLTTSFPEPFVGPEEAVGHCLIAPLGAGIVDGAGEEIE